MRLDLGGERHGVRAGIDAIDNLDLLLVYQTLDVVDRDIHLALAVGINGHDLILAGNAAAFVDEVDCDLGPYRTGN
jgi:hypothetical protein